MRSFNCLTIMRILKCNAHTAIMVLKLLPKNSHELTIKAFIRECHKARNLLTAPQKINSPFTGADKLRTISVLSQGAFQFTASNVDATLWFPESNEDDFSQAAIEWLGWSSDEGYRAVLYTRIGETKVKTFVAREYPYIQDALICCIQAMGFTSTDEALAVTLATQLSILES